MNRLEQAIAFISPKAAFNRARYSAALQVKRAYDAAARTTRTENWRTNNSSANTEVRTALSVMRDRSRELVRNNPYARRAVRQIYTNVIGVGIKPSFTASSKQIEKKVKDLWSLWAESVDCDWEGELNFYSMQKLIMRTVSQSGECLVRIRRNGDKKLPLPIQLQVLEADFIDMTRDGYSMEADGSFTVMGIKFDKHGRRLGYWLYESHPGDSFVSNTRFVSNFIPSDEVVHVYFKDRPGQVRGVPELVPSMVRMKDLDDFESAELVKQKIAACFTAFTHGTAESLPSLATGTKDDKYERLEPGLIIDLSAGREISFANPPVHNGFGEYMKQTLRGIAAGIGVTYEGMTGDLSQVNFSSGRMGWLEFHKVVSDYQSDMIIPMCSKVFAAFTVAAMVSMKLSEKVTTVKTSWTCPRREMIDPVKESKAITQMLRSGLISWQEAIRELGKEPEVVLAQMVSDKKAFDDAGLMPDSDPRFDPVRMNKAAKASADAGVKK